LKDDTTLTSQGRDGIHRGRVQFVRYVYPATGERIKTDCPDLVDEYHQYANADLEDEVYEVQEGEEGGEEEQYLEE